MEAYRYQQLAYLIVPIIPGMGFFYVQNMREKRIDFRLYLITDRRLFPDHHSLLIAVEEALKGGVKAVQLREKDIGTRELLDMAYDFRSLTDGYNAKLFINDRVDIALAVKAEGVHLGNSGMPAYAAKKASGGNLLIGVSTHSLKEAVDAEKDGADFITLGPVFETPSKKRYGKPLGTDILRKVRDEISIPILVIGGISTGRVEKVLQSGAHGIAVISAVLTSDNIKTITEEFMRLLK